MNNVRSSHMSLDDRVYARCLAHARHLERLASASVDDADVRGKFAALSHHLNELHELRPTAFKDELIRQIESCSAVGAKAIPLEKGISTLDTSFVAGHLYLAETGVYKVVALDPYPRITPQRYPECQTAYFMGYMWEEHVRLLELTRARQKEFNTFARTYTVPLASAEDDLSVIKAEYDAEVIAAHRAFLEQTGIAYSGTRQTSRARRLAHCYNCKERLDNAIDTECNRCQWIVCSCGACGCGYSPSA
jgi:hypothetical protein